MASFSQIPPKDREGKVWGVFCKIKACFFIPWKQNIVDLTTLSSLVAPWVIVMAIYGAISDDKIVSWRYFVFSVFLSRTVLYRLPQYIHMYMYIYICVYMYICIYIYIYIYWLTVTNPSHRCLGHHVNSDLPAAQHTLFVDFWICISGFTIPIAPGNKNAWRQPS